MKQAIVLQHASFEGPGRIAPLLSERGYALDVRHLYRGDAVPSRLAANEVLIVMGGPMGVEDLERAEFGYLRREVQLLSRCVEEDAPVLGVCLGAQLLAFAAGAAVRPMVNATGERCYEVGWAPVRFHAQGSADPILRGLPAEAPMLHWHGDQFEIPSRARLLASTALCAQQAFQLRSRLFGLQFHCEVTAANVADFLREDDKYVARANGPAGVQRLKLETEHYLPSFEAVGNLLLRNLLNVMTDTPRT
ncbi:MAG TPA: gamma-glutamyl-gamma-aminobutyrate hydrolase family protein [Polyangiaceae bacterium]|jgi:GMP synthase-like glutamine amidotransferase|nr:gamma-glutamyl-gamma-aminobutyrate hydrolase family protein [Polyangiaceae bacterium]